MIVHNDFQAVYLSLLINMCIHNVNLVPLPCIAVYIPKCNLCFKVHIVRPYILLIDNFFEFSQHSPTSVPESLHILVEIRYIQAFLETRV